MRQFRYMIFAATAMMIMILVSCQMGSINPADTLTVEQQEQYGDMTVRLPSGRGWIAAKYAVTASRSGEKPVTKETTSTDSPLKMRLKVGKWSFKAVGYDSKGVAVFRSDDVEGDVKSDNSSSLTIILAQQSAGAEFAVIAPTVLQSKLNKITVSAATEAGDGFTVSKEISSIDQKVQLSGLLTGYEYTITADGYIGTVKYATAAITKTYSEVGVIDKSDITLTQCRVTAVECNKNDGASFSSADDTIILSCGTENAVIYYTVDGSDPSESSARYTAPIALFAGETVAASKTVRAVAYAGTMTPSDVLTASYSFDPTRLATPIFSVHSGSYTADQSLTLTSSDGGTIKYKTDNGDWQDYTESIAISGSQTKDVIVSITAYVTGIAEKSDSLEVTQTYTISYPQLSAPAFKASDEHYDTETSFTLSSSVNDASIYYTTDGTTPTVGSTKYTEPFKLDVGTYTVKAIAVKSGYKNSAVSSWEWNITDVEIPVTAIEISPISAALVVGGDAAAFSVTYTPADANTDKTIEWSIDDDTIASVTPNGASAMVTGLKQGSASLTAVLKSNPSIRKTAALSVTTTTLPPVSGSLGEMHPDTGDYSPADESSWGSSVYTLGANVSDGNTTFALYSANATKVLLEIYDAAYGADAKYDYWMTKNTSNNQWQVKLSGNLTGKMYAFRVWGPNWTFSESWTRGNSGEGFVGDYDSTGNRFNPNKVVFDPYAREISHDKSNPAALGTENGGIYGTGAELYNGIARRNFDTGKYAPKAVVINDTTDYGTKPQIAAKDAIVYEAHARGLTKHPSVSSLSSILSGMDGFEGVENIPDQYRGTYKGATYMVKYLKALGINTIELLPVHESDNDGNLDNSAGGNYWAYMTYGYFAPDRRYSYDKSLGGPTKEFKEMVKAFHDEGMEVYLDVVYNHTGEGGPWYGEGTGEHEGDDFKTCEITSMRGIDNQTYYSLCNTNNKGYWETTGCGNNLQCDNTVVRQFILDSLTYWIEQMGVDGFRFDLAPVLGREKSGDDWVFSSSATTLTQIASLGASKNAEMIAEAWDTQWPGGYQVGQFPAGWGEWNGRFRDSIRNFVGNGVRGALNDYINGDYSNFYDQGGPQRSVNFVVAHDGYTLADLCSGYSVAGPNYNGSSSSLQWPFGPSDGGDGSVAGSAFGSAAADKRQANRNYTAIQMMSRGVPMIVWGDEFCRTQNGNNNPYNVDSVATWNNYNMINTSSPHLVATGDTTGGTMAYHNNFGTFGNTENVNGNFKFMQYMLNLRKNEPALRQDTYNVGYDFKKEDGTSSLEDGDRCVWLRIGGSSVTGGHDYLVFMNMYTEQVTFSIPAAKSGYHWIRVADTQNYFETDYNCWDETVAAELDTSYGVSPWSVVIFKEVQDTPTCEAPVIIGSLGYSFEGGENVITLAANTEGAAIYYTLDGTEPSAGSGTAYSSPFTITKTTTIKAITVKAGYKNSAVTEKLFTNTAVCDDPVLSVPAGDFWNTITVFVSGSDDYYYTTNGSEPTTGSTAYTSAGIDISVTTTLKVLAHDAGGTKSDAIVTAVYTKQADPSITEDPSGVMLQGFNWASADTTTSNWYTVIKNNANAIKNNFEYIWMPPPSKTPSFAPQGYIPTELNNLNGYYGSASELGEAIAAVGGTKAIADIVVNHRGGANGWGDFENPRWTADYMSICSGDEGFTDSTSGNELYNWNGAKGGADTGTNYDAARDLDHTNTAVQKGIFSWMNSVLRRAGFVGWRYDFVKGYAPEYVGYYNAKSSAAFSVGELWVDSNSYGQTKSWIDGTAGTVSGTAGVKSRAFDFALKEQMDDIFGFTNSNGGHEGDTENFSQLASGSLMADSSYRDYAVTFVDNHDTGSTQKHRLMDEDGIAPAYTLILTHPGMPCVAWQHYFTAAESLASARSNESTDQYIGGKTVPGTGLTYHQLIDRLIAIRKSAGITTTSAVNVIETTNAEGNKHYVARVTGTTGELIVKIGGGPYTPSESGYAGNLPVAVGTNFAVWEKNKTIADYETLSTVEMYFYNSDNWSPVNAHVWTADGQDWTSWPGAVMTADTGSWVKLTIPSTATNVIFTNNGSDTGKIETTFSSSTPVYKDGAWYDTKANAEAGIGGSITITVNCKWDDGNDATGLWDGGAQLYVWVCYNQAETQQEWIACTQSSSSSVAFEVAQKPYKINVVRFTSSTTQYNWSGQWWNQSNSDIMYQDGTTVYTSQLKSGNT